MEYDDVNLEEEPDDEFFDTFFDDDALETIGRVWNNSKDDVLNHNSSLDDIQQRSSNEKQEKTSVLSTDKHLCEYNELSPSEKLGSRKSSSSTNYSSLKTSLPHNNVDVLLIERECPPDKEPKTYPRDSKVCNSSSEEIIQNCKMGAQRKCTTVEVVNCSSSIKVCEDDKISDFSTNHSKISLEGLAMCSKSAEEKLHTTPSLQSKKKFIVKSNKKMVHQDAAPCTEVELLSEDVCSTEIKEIPLSLTVEKVKIQLNLKSKSSSQSLDALEVYKSPTSLDYNDGPDKMLLERSVCVRNVSNIPLLEVDQVEPQVEASDTSIPTLEDKEPEHPTKAPSGLFCKAISPSLEDGEVGSLSTASSVNACTPILEDGEVESPDEATNVPSSKSINPLVQKEEGEISLNRIPAASPDAASNASLQSFEKGQSSGHTSFSANNLSDRSLLDSDKLKPQCGIRLLSTIVSNPPPQLDDALKGDNKSKKKKKKRSDSLRSKSPSSKRVKLGSPDVQFAPKSRQNSPKRNRNIRADSSERTEKRKRNSPSVEKEITLRGRSRSRSDSPIRSKRPSKSYKKYKSYRYRKNGTRSRSRSVSRSPVRRRQRRVSRSPRHWRSRSSSRSPSRRRPSRRSRLSPCHRFSKSPSYSKCRSSRSRSRSPFINEICRLKQKWAEEDNARKANSKPPSMVSSVNDSMCEFLPRVPSWNSDSTHMVSVSVESVQVHSTSFSMNDVFHPPPPIGFMYPPPAISYAPNIPMDPFTTSSGQSLLIPQADGVQQCLQNYIPPSLPGPPPFQLPPEQQTHPLAPVFNVTSPTSSFTESPSSNRFTPETGQPGLQAPELRRQLAILKSSVVSQQTSANFPLHVNDTQVPSKKIPHKAPSTQHIPLKQVHPSIKSTDYNSEKQCEIDARASCTSQTKEPSNSASSMLVSNSSSRILKEVPVDEKRDSLSPSKSDLQITCTKNYEEPKSEETSTTGQELTKSIETSLPQKDTSDDDSDVIFLEAPEKPAPVLVCLSGDEVSDIECPEIYDIANELKKIQKDSQKLHKLQKKTETKKNKKAKRRKRKRSKQITSADNVAKDVLKDCYDFIDSSRIGRFFLHVDENPVKEYHDDKEAVGSNSVLWKGISRMKFSFTKPLSQEERPLKQDACTNTPSILSLDISTSTENVTVMDTGVQADATPCSACSKQNDLTTLNQELQVQVENLLRERDTLISFIRSQHDDSSVPDFLNTLVGSTSRMNLERIQVLPQVAVPDSARITGLQSLAHGNIVPETDPVACPRSGKFSFVSQNPVLSYEYHHSSSVPTEVVPHGIFDEFSSVPEICEKRHPSCP